MDQLTEHIDATAPDYDVDPGRPYKRKSWEKVDPIGSLPFLCVHAGALLVFLAGFNWVAALTCLATFGMRMFGITGGYHRYFSHRTYKTSRAFQFVMAWLGASSAQLGPLWWAAHHRHHHRHSDTEDDVHSPIVRTFFWSHVGWIMCRKNEATNLSKIRDFAKFPELRFLNKYHVIPPLVLVLVLTIYGIILQTVFPGLGVTAFQIIVWGFFVSTVALYHCTFSINSLAHVIGTRRFDTEDHSKNNFLLAIATMGEGWHNNHHRYPSSERQGYYWWEIDITHYILRILSWFRLVWDIKTPPKEIYVEAKQKKRKT